jgi:hypothetical protein
MKQLIQRFESIDLSILRKWVIDRQQEDLHLEFKTLFEKKTFAKVVSGFANSEGGIVVWGVDGRKDEKGVDAASDLRPLPNAAAVLSQLQSLTGDSVSPIVDGVSHRLIDVENGAGCIATLVPASDAGPHMAKLGENRYYKRSGDSFYVLEHFDLADMFGRRAQPLLVVTIKPKVGSRSYSAAQGHKVWLEPIIVIENQGRGMARFPYLRVKASPPYEFAGPSLAGLPELPRIGKEKGWRIFAGGANDVIHASTILPVSALRLQVSEHDETLEDLLIEYEVTCEGIQSRRDEIKISGGELRELARASMDEARKK